MEKSLLQKQVESEILLHENQLGIEDHLDDKSDEFVDGFYKGFNWRVQWENDLHQIFFGDETEEVM